MSHLHPAGQEFLPPPPESRMTPTETDGDSADAGAVIGRLDQRFHDNDYALQLQTPDHRRVVSSADNGARKRPLPLYPDRVVPSKQLDGKRRQVAKSLSFGESPPFVEANVQVSKVSRCLYGSPPLKDEVLSDFNSRTLEQFNAFVDKYSIVEEMGTSIKEGGVKVTTYKCTQNQV